MELNERFGRRLRSIRRGMDITQADLAKKLNVSQVTISNVEHGTAKVVDDEFIESTAKALGVPLEELMK